MADSLRLTHLRLAVADLDRSLDYYVARLGFVLHGRSERSAELGGASAAAGPSLLALEGLPDAVPAPRDAAGLFHAALLLPERPALGAWLQRAAENAVEFDGFSDHAVSEAVYLTDPDGNGLEFYCDRPQAAWPFAPDGEVAMTTRPLDVRGLLATASSRPPANPLADARWGHLHLRVVDLDSATDYYRARLGVAVTQSSYPGARFLAADGYHHHLALNTWTRSQRPPPPGVPGLAAATFSRVGTAATPPEFTPEGFELRVEPAASP